MNLFASTLFHPSGMAGFTFDVCEQEMKNNPTVSEISNFVIMAPAATYMARLVALRIWSRAFFISDGADSTRRSTRRREQADHFYRFHAPLPQSHDRAPSVSVVGLKEIGMRSRFAPKGNGTLA